ncbi:hypothetical protein GCM10028791_39730 [Echinicola sediminis]
MRKQSVDLINRILFKGLPITITVIGSFLLLYHYFFDWNTALPIQPGIFTEMTKVPLDIFNWGLAHYTLEVENYLVFQNFEVLLPSVQTTKTLVFGTLIWLLCSVGISLITHLKRYYFIAAMTVLIFMLTFSGINSLNIGGISSNVALIILLLGTVAPAMLLHVFFDHISLTRKTLIIAPTAILTMAGLIASSETTDPALMMAENISLVALAITAIFTLYIGHSLISAFFLLITRLNQGVGIKISWHLSIFSISYLLILFLVLMDKVGSLSLPFALPPLFPLFLLAGYIGHVEVKEKLRQINQPFSSPIIGLSFYWLGFAISTLTYWKTMFSANRPMEDFLEHWLVYTQLAMSLLFFAYLLTNFSGFMNSGKPLADVTFRPKFFAYYHMRIGSLIALLSIIVYADGVIAPQLSTSATNLSADYYYATGKPLEARILFENSWQRYRKNEKAKVATILLYQKENQPTLARKNIEESLEWSPSVHEIILAANHAHKREKYFDALYYLEKGLEIYPDNAWIKNNLALLYSKGNKAKEALAQLEDISQSNSIAQSNKIGLMVKHRMTTDEEFGPKDLAGNTNLMALKNAQGQLADFQLPSGDAHTPIMQQAMLRNQWTNKPFRPLEADLKELDSLASVARINYEERQLRTSRVIRSYQENQVGEALKYLNGLAIDFSTSSGYYHSLAAKILIGQGDMEKAALEFIQAEESGFQNFQDQYLPVLYYGGQSEKAFELAEKYELDFPDWMKVQMDSESMESEESVFFRQLALLNKASKEAFLGDFEQLSSPTLKAIMAHEILLKKGHWLDRAEISALQDFLSKQEGIDHEYIRQLCDVLTSGKPLSEVPQGSLVKLFPGSSISNPNPYLSPFVLKRVDQLESDEKKYELLRNAADFNSDPLLWLEMINYSHKIGLGEYGEAALQQLSGWADSKSLQKLQLQP